MNQRQGLPLAAQVGNLCYVCHERGYGFDILRRIAETPPRRTLLFLLAFAVAARAAIAQGVGK